MHEMASVHGPTSSYSSRFPWPTWSLVIHSPVSHSVSPSIYSLVLRTPYVVTVPSNEFHESTTAVLASLTLRLGLHRQPQALSPRHPLSCSVLYHSSLPNLHVCCSDPSSWPVFSPRTLLHELALSSLFRLFAAPKNRSLSNSCFFIARRQPTPIRRPRIHSSF